MTSKQRRTIELTEAIRKEIVAFIRAGASPHVAAEAAGVPRRVFERWLEIGEGRPRPGKKTRKMHPVYTPFRREVMQAEASARVVAEITAFQADPISWLKHGPGKDRPGYPGWSSTVRPVIHEDNSQNINLLLSPEISGLFASLLRLLMPWPDARMAVIEALGQAQKNASLPPPRSPEPPPGDPAEHTESA